MNIQDLKNSGRIMYEAIGGSRAYNLHNEQSDEDIKGIFLNRQSEYMSITPPDDQVNDDKNDTVYYSLKRFLELARTANPNILEMLWYPADCIKISTEAMEYLKDHRKVFVSKKAYFSHAKYAESQIKKSRGSNKKVHNPQPEKMPSKEDFCWIIHSWKGIQIFDDPSTLNVDRSTFPARPCPLEEIEIDLSRCNAASLEHAHNVFRLYDYGDDAKGVFRGGHMLIPESIPIPDEFERFVGLLIYNQQAYEKALKEWNSYWTWMRERNPQRWEDQESGKRDYDSKNMMHCMRLLMSGENVLKNGEPLVRFDGDVKDYLMSIRNGELEYDVIMKEVDARMKRMESMFESSTLPEEADINQINRILYDVTRLASEGT